MSVRLRAHDRRRQLLRVARGVFAATGFHATSMDDVAEAAGVTKPVLYQHFANKRALYVELLEDVGLRLVEEIGQETGRARTGREQVERGFRAYFRFVAENQAAFRLLFGASVRNDREFAAVAERVVSEVAEVVSGLIDVDAAPEQRLALAHAVVGMAEATSRRVVSGQATGDETDPSLLASWLSELAWYGLRGIRPVSRSEGRSGPGPLATP
ncbi:MAG: TetR/AcrR family transcriptional regulator [Actinobacteria bacterium]|nr:TetR/AcrR family transcriptional regulator [Actinomycetota bacterium]